MMVSAALINNLGLEEIQEIKIPQEYNGDISNQTVDEQLDKAEHCDSSTEYKEISSGKDKVFMSRNSFWPTKHMNSGQNKDPSLEYNEVSAGKDKLVQFQTPTKGGLP